MKIFSLLIFSICLFLFCNSAAVAADDNTNLSLQINMLPWEQVNELIPKYNEFTIIDLETGKQFNVQRRAGNSHADVQPLTPKDTKIMKDIYNGKWSWQRRAILVQYNDQLIPASMNGMPHGMGSLDNNFPGHFCVYFYGSKTHGSKNEDLAHKLMIFKASGKLSDFLHHSDPSLLVQAYITGLNQKDVEILSHISLQEIDWKNILQSIAYMKLEQDTNMENSKEKILTNMAIPVEIKWIDQHSKRKEFSGKIYLHRFSQTDPWKIDSHRLFKDIELDYSRDIKKD